jgi:hypothetical protein
MMQRHAGNTETRDMEGSTSFKSHVTRMQQVFERWASIPGIQMTQFLQGTNCQLCVKDEPFYIKDSLYFS